MPRINQKTLMVLVVSMTIAPTAFAKPVGSKSINATTAVVRNVTNENVSSTVQSNRGQAEKRLADHRDAMRRNWAP